MEGMHGVDFTEFLNSAFVQTALKPLVLTIGSVFTAKACVYFGKIVHTGYNENVKTLWRKYDLLEKYGEYVVITNAGDPLGAAFARQFAKQGHSLILIHAKNDQQFEEALPKIQKCVQTDKGRQLRLITKDWDRGDHIIYDTIDKELRNEEIREKIGILINNSGVIQQDDDNFLTVNPKQVLREVHRCIVDFLMVTKSVLTVMAVNQKGLIVNVSSPGTCRPSSRCVPISMDQFIDDFNRIVQREIRKHRGIKVKVEAIHPGTICTGPSCCPDRESRMNPLPHVFVRSAMKVIGNVNSSTGYFYHGVNKFASSMVPELVKDVFEEVYQKMNPGKPMARPDGYSPIESDVESGRRRNRRRRTKQDFEIVPCQPAPAPSNE